MAIRTAPGSLPATAVRKVHLTPCVCAETARQDGPGETTVRALGQKVWMTSHGDISLLDMAYCTFHAQENDGA